MCLLLCARPIQDYVQRGEFYCKERRWELWGRQPQNFPCKWHTISQTWPGKYLSSFLKILHLKITVVPGKKLQMSLSWFIFLVDTQFEDCCWLPVTSFPFPLCSGAGQNSIIEGQHKPRRERPKQETFFERLQVQRFQAFYVVAKEHRNMTVTLWTKSY